MARTQPARVQFEKGALKFVIEGLNAEEVAALYRDVVKPEIPRRRAVVAPKRDLKAEHLAKLDEEAAIKYGGGSNVYSD